MEEPLLPTALQRKWKWATVATASTSAALVIVYVTILMDAGSGYGGMLLPRLMQLAVYLSAIGAAACAARYNIEGTRALINHQVVVTAARHNRRLDAISNGMVEHGIKLDDSTVELGKVRHAVQNHTHPVVQFGGYDAGTAKVYRATARASVVDPDVIDMAARLQNRMIDS